MITWYKDDEIGIFFSIHPEIDVQYPCNCLNEKDKKKICAKPFLNKQEIDVILMDYVNDEAYEFTIPSNYTWDGASIPRLFWFSVGSKTDNRFLIPSMIHDVLCENHHYVDSDRYFSTIVFERLLYVSGVNAFNRWRMKHSVDNFQKVFGGW